MRFPFRPHRSRLAWLAATSVARRQQDQARPWPLAFPLLI
ncbi:UNVERIFIED_CONTAM: hypothetical protein GTU68_003630 [Idotea baltica]|nr:hypothetical protein [Idotea baltica]